jgi:hypothetical protein
MVKWNWRRVGITDFASRLLFLVCVVIAEISEGLHITTTTGASASKLGALRRGETWNTHSRLSGILKFKCIHP